MPVNPESSSRRRIRKKIEEKKRTVGGADSRRVAAVVSSGLDSVGCGLASETLIFSSSLSFYPHDFIELYKLLFSKLISSVFFIFFVSFSCSGQRPLSGFQITTTTVQRHPSSPFIGYFVVVVF